MKKLCSILILTALVVAMFAGCTNGGKAKNILNPVYNVHSCGMNVSWSDNSASTQELTKEQIQAILPADMPKGAEVSGVADLNEGGSVLRVKIYFVKNEVEVSLIMGNDAERYGCCASFEGDAQDSVAGNIAYILYENSDEKKPILAHGLVNGVPLLVRLDAEDREKGKEFFEDILSYIGTYEVGQPELILKK